METLKPFWDRIVVKPIYPEQQTKMGIFITDADHGDCGFGKIVEAGPGLPDDNGKVQAMDVKIGDHIFFNKNDGVSVKLNGEYFLVMKEVDVIAVQDSN